MKHFFLSLLLLTALSSCSKKNNSVAPTSGLSLPANYDVSLRVTGQGLSGLGARMQTTVASAFDGNPPIINPSFGISDSYNSSVSQTYRLANVPRYTKGQNIRRFVFRTTIQFTSIPAGGIPPTSGARLKVELLADGKTIPINSIGNNNTQAELTAANVPQVYVDLQTEYL